MNDEYTGVHYVSLFTSVYVRNLPIKRKNIVEGVYVMEACDVSDERSKVKHVDWNKTILGKDHSFHQLR